jgi:site-specific recombinase XerD
MRLPNGYGTVYKLPGNRRNPWISRITTKCVIIDNKIKQQYQTIGYFKEKSDGIDALAKYRIAPVASNANITLVELYKEWSEIKYEEEISRQTIDCYKAGWKHLSKYSGVKFKDLRSGHFQSVINNCAKNKMSRSTLEKIKVVAFMLYSYAMEHDVVNKNYAELIKLPKIEREEKLIFTDIEIQKLEKSDIPWVDTILILIYTGMRINEILSLTRFSVDMNEQIITGGLKTDSGKNRVIPIHPKILKYVQGWLDKNGEYLICNEQGKHLSDKIYREKFYYPTLEKLEIRKLNPHCCRHTFASLMNKAGADTISIQKLIGHSKYSFTADTYTHTNLDELRKAINRL